MLGNSLNCRGFFYSTNFALETRQRTISFSIYYRVNCQQHLLCNNESVKTVCASHTRKKITRDTRTFMLHVKSIIKTGLSSFQHHRVSLITLIASLIFLNFQLNDSEKKQGGKTTPTPQLAIHTSLQPSAHTFSKPLQTRPTHRERTFIAHTLKTNYQWLD